MLRRPPSLTRRTTVGAALLGLTAVAGCDLDDLDPRSDPTSPGEPTASPPAEDADSAVVTGVVGDLTALLASIRAVPRSERATFRPLARLHRQHLAALGGAEQGAAEETEATSTPAPAPVAAVELIRQEERVRGRLTTAAVAAQSGELARLLGSMSAALAQQLAVLPRDGAAR